MDTGWIQVFVLTLSECVAPAGKTVCQPQEFELTFLTETDCKAALSELVALKSASERVIIDPADARCVPTARQLTVYASAWEIDEAFAGTPGWKTPEISAEAGRENRQAHEDRLARLPTCEESRGVRPCKVGEIIVEPESGQPVEIWRRGD